ncbi:MAG TPA: peptidoglycan-associated lipoprotein Pal [Patescibacteria group bacterium]|nr:peptidoglycan-associated lipoprotein Pal [Patescibacteria group bacterium]
MPRYGWLVIVLALMLVLPSCAKKVTVPVEEMEKPIEEIAPPPPPPVEMEEQEPVDIEEEEIEPIVLNDIFFDFDKYDIKAEYKKVLSQNAELILADVEAKILIEGHCDERGTNEYNLALGEKRAKAVMDFYTAYGIPSVRLSMVSYGEERPFTFGHDETAWAKNRRAHMVIQ